VKWYAKLALTFGGLVVFVGGLIVYDEVTTGEIVWKTIAVAEPGAKQTFTIPITNAGARHTLVVSPTIKSGHGEPDVHLSLSLASPAGEELVSVKRDEVFGGAASVNPDAIVSRTYRQRFAFTPAEAGPHRLSLTVFSPEVKDVYLAIGMRSEARD
jgi:hypothetical protein